MDSYSAHTTIYGYVDSITKYPDVRHGADVARFPPRLLPFRIMLHCAGSIAAVLALWMGDLSPLLDRRFPEPSVQFLVMDANTRDVIESRWPRPEEPVPVGSLVKPFLALACSGGYPEFDCKGSQSGCWLARGHGHLGLSHALAFSCNAYFLNLARHVEREALAATTAKFDIPAPVRETAQARIGLRDGWPIAPLALMRAYTQLASRRGDPRVAPILAGLALAARSGSASAIGNGALAKTGTAPDSGYTLVLDPADAPRIALLVRVRGHTGSETARTAARILSTIRTGR